MATSKETLDWVDENYGPEVAALATLPTRERYPRTIEDEDRRFAKIHEDYLKRKREENYENYLDEAALDNEKKNMWLKGKYNDNARGAEQELRQFDSSKCGPHEVGKVSSCETYKPMAQWQENMVDSAEDALFGKGAENEGLAEGLVLGLQPELYLANMVRQNMEGSTRTPGVLDFLGMGAAARLAKKGLQKIGKKTAKEFAPNATKKAEEYFKTGMNPSGITRENKLPRYEDWGNISSDEGRFGKDYSDDIGWKLQWRGKNKEPIYK